MLSMPPHAPAWTMSRSSRTDDGSGVSTERGPMSSRTSSTLGHDSANARAAAGSWAGRSRASTSNGGWATVRWHSPIPPRTVRSGAEVQ